MINVLTLPIKLTIILKKAFDYAFDKDFGYLTCCPTNAGTGLRASVMVHLPGYVLTGKFNELAASLSQLGLTVRGIFGEGSKGLGNIFQNIQSAYFGSFRGGYNRKIKTKLFLK